MFDKDSYKIELVKALEAKEFKEANRLIANAKKVRDENGSSFSKQEFCNIISEAIYKTFNGYEMGLKYRYNPEKDFSLKGMKTKILEADPNSGLTMDDLHTDNANRNMYGFGAFLKAKSTRKHQSKEADEDNSDRCSYVATDDTCP